MSLLDALQDLNRLNLTKRVSLLRQLPRTDVIAATSSLSRKARFEIVEMITCTRSERTFKNRVSSGKRIYHL